MHFRYLMDAVSATMYRRPNHSVCVDVISSGQLLSETDTAVQRDQMNHRGLLTIIWDFLQQALLYELLSGTSS